MPLTITLPEERRDLLAERVDGYRRQLQQRLTPFQRICVSSRIAVGERVLRDSTVDTIQLGLDLQQGHSAAYDFRSFANACAVISDLCQTGGINTRDGAVLRRP